MLTHNELHSLAKTTASVVREQIQKLTSKLAARVDAVEELLLETSEKAESAASQADVRALTDLVEAIPAGKDGTDGASVTVEDVLPELKAHIDSVIAQLPAPKDGVNGESVTVDDVRPLVEAQVDKFALDFERRAQDVLRSAIDRMPVAKDGEDGLDADPDEVAERIIAKLNLSGIDKDDIRALCAELVSVAVAKIDIPKAPEPSDEQLAKAVSAYFRDNPVREPEDGQNATDDQVQRAVAAYLKDNPPAPGEDGESVVIDDVLPALREDIREAVKTLAPPRDGKDGEPGQDGRSVTVSDVEPLLESLFSRWALDWEKRSQDVLQRSIDRVPIPKDGKDGKDGLELKTFEATLSEDGRQLTIALGHGDRRIERTIDWPAPRYLEIWKDSTEYFPGDFVTYDGSMWACLKKTKSKPGGYNKSWRLAVKRGRNGKSS